MAYNVYHFEIPNKLSHNFMASKNGFHLVIRGGGRRGVNCILCVRAKETGQVKNCLGECKILVFNPDYSATCHTVATWIKFLISL